jgi:hypothetical protein
MKTSLSFSIQLTKALSLKLGTGGWTCGEELKPNKRPLELV